MNIFHKPALLAMLLMHGSEYVWAQDLAPPIEGCQRQGELLLQLRDADGLGNKKTLFVGTPSLRNIEKVRLHAEFLRGTRSAASDANMQTIMQDYRMNLDGYRKLAHSARRGVLERQFVWPACPTNPVAMGKGIPGTVGGGNGGQLPGGTPSPEPKKHCPHGSTCPE